MNRREFLAASAGGLLSAVVARAESNSGGALEQEVAASSDNGIFRDLFLTSDYYPYGHVSSGAEKIENMVSIIKRHGLDLTRTYEEGSTEGILQERLRLYTHCLYKDVQSLFRHSKVSYKGDPSYEADLSDSLCALLEVEETFGSHPFHHVIIGRQKAIVKIATEKNLPVPDEFQKYVGADIPKWQEPNLDYRSLDELRNAKDKEDLGCIPPEYRN